MRVLGTRTEEIELKEIILKEQDVSVVSSVKEKLSLSGNVTRAATGKKHSIVMNYFVIDEKS